MAISSCSFSYQTSSAEVKLPLSQPFTAALKSTKQTDTIQSSKPNSACRLAHIQLPAPILPGVQQKNSFYGSRNAFGIKNLICSQPSNSSIDPDSVLASYYSVEPLNLVASTSAASGERHAQDQGVSELCTSNVAHALESRYLTLGTTSIVSKTNMTVHVTAKPAICSGNSAMMGVVDTSSAALDLDQPSKFFGQAGNCFTTKSSPTNPSWNDISAQANNSRAVQCRIPSRKRPRAETTQANAQLLDLERHDQAVRLGEKSIPNFGRIENYRPRDDSMQRPYSTPPQFPEVGMKGDGSLPSIATKFPEPKASGHWRGQSEYTSRRAVDTTSSLLTAEGHLPMFSDDTASFRLTGNGTHSWAVSGKSSENNIIGRKSIALAQSDTLGLNSYLSRCSVPSSENESVDITARLPQDAQEHGNLTSGECRVLPTSCSETFHSKCWIARCPNTVPTGGMCKRHRVDILRECYHGECKRSANSSSQLCPFHCHSAPNAFENAILVPIHQSVLRTEEIKTNCCSTSQTDKRFSPARDRPSTRMKDAAIMRRNKTFLLLILQWRRQRLEERRKEREIDLRRKKKRKSILSHLIFRSDKSTSSAPHLKLTLEANFRANNVLAGSRSSPSRMNKHLLGYHSSLMRQSSSMSTAVNILPPPRRSVALDQHDETDDEDDLPLANLHLTTGGAKTSLVSGVVASQGSTAVAQSDSDDANIPRLAATSNKLQLVGSARGYTCLDSQTFSSPASAHTSRTKTQPYQEKLFTRIDSDVLDYNAAYKKTTAA